MEILLAVAALSVCALLWACWAVSRHVRRTVKQPVVSGQNSIENIYAAPVRASKIARLRAAKPASPRKQPQRVERADVAHFNKDFGDLRDPYQHRPRINRRQVAN